MTLKARIRCAIAAAIAMSSLSVNAQTRYRTEAELVSSVLPAVVDIYIRRVDPKSGKSPLIEDNVGAGFIVDPSGIIVTNTHVVEGAYSIQVRFHDGEFAPARLMGKALTFDVAFIKVDARRPMQPASIGDSDKIRVGERVVAIGNPWGHNSSVSAGVISALHRSVGMSAYDDLIQVDAAINQGNSGGPLFNMDGEVIGVNQALFQRNAGGSIGIGFSIPINDVKFLARNVVEYGHPNIGRLGVVTQAVNPAMADALNRSISDGGMIISEVLSNSPAAKAGLKQGDIILQIDGDPIRTGTALNRKIAASVDKTLKFVVARGAKNLALVVTIEPAANDIWSTTMPAAPKITSVASLGLTFAPKRDAAAVETVEPDSLAWSAGIRSGDVISRVGAEPVDGPQAFEKRIKALRRDGARNAILLLTGENGARWVGLRLRE